MIAVAGAVTCIAAARATWFSSAPRIVEFPGPGSSVARLPVEGKTTSGLESGAGLIVGGAAGAAILVVFGTLSAGRLRRVLLGAGLLAAVAGFVGLVVAQTHRSGISEALQIHPVPIAVTAVAVTATLAGAAAAFSAGGSAVYLRMPEGVPATDEQVESPDG